MSILLKSFAFILLFSLFNCDCTSSTDDADVTESYLVYYDKRASESSCPKRQFSESEVKYGAYKCCYETADCYGTDVDGDREDIYLKACVALSKAEYENIAQMAKKGKANCSNFRIECSSTSLSYLYLVYLLLLFLF